MGSESFLHEQSDFDELIRVVSGEHGIAPQLVEKDYWIMHCLFGLTSQEFSFQLKGGTSLSKGYNIIDRFSEDIDIQIDSKTNTTEHRQAVVLREFMAHGKSFRDD